MEIKILIIAEAGVNHNGDLELAKQLIDVAAEAGADYVKFQTFKAEKVIARSAPKADYQIQNTGKADESQLEMVRRLELDKEKHLVLIEHCQKAGIKFLSTAFDHESVDLLEELGIDLYKIPSGEITNLPFLRKVARKQKPVILSTGMATLGEIEDALDALMREGLQRDMITVLHCNTEYPTPLEDVNLRAMQTIGQAFQVRVGYSDHTLGITVPIAAVALGAVCIEKHFTLDRNMEGPDHRASLEPAELKAMVKAIREVETALGSPLKQPSPSERKNRPVARKSIHLAVDLPAGHVLSEAELIMKRPGDGISPMRMSEVLGRPLAQARKADHQLQWTDLQ